MKIKDNYMLRKVADTFVVVPVGEAVAEFNGMINLNEVGAFLWRQLESETTFESVLQAVLAEYEVDESVAKADLERFVKELEEANLIV
ncbi:MAG: PqqD family protein [Ruminococcaceae bacterium]|nr:PqqD family protein [Oscillospiraceae bacterium]